jgi:hypothetical protein
MILPSSMGKPAGEIIKDVMGRHWGQDAINLITSISNLGYQIENYDPNFPNAPDWDQLQADFYGAVGGLQDLWGERRTGEGTDFGNWLTGLETEYGITNPAVGGGGGGGGTGQDPNAALLEILKNFGNALDMYVRSPGSLLGQEDTTRGWGGNVADWLRGNQSFIEQLFEENYMGAQAGQDLLQEYTPTDFFEQFRPYQQMSMSRRQPTGYMPAISVRRLRG